jgi:hypothetical protein
MDCLDQSPWRTSISCSMAQAITLTVCLTSSSSSTTTFYSLASTAHPQQPLYQFFPPQQQPQHALSRQPSPRPHPSPAPASIPASPHPLFVQQQQQQQQSQLARETTVSNQDHRDPEVPVDQIQEDAPIDEEPLYVNAKQYYRILKRRVARARLEEVHRLSRQRKVRCQSLQMRAPYLYLQSAIPARVAAQTRYAPPSWPRRSLPHC